ncbi:MAG: aminotransferase class I/II-fold pyridoxal phosphate-dependent enzyme, partial [Candidatus Eremiobacteraeota bacterium]|nr:aminotransferase class I/II-fold pyridoxal phosphate-dependent enzyme [Candidatus Eremiobacteraeota bacterium]
PRHEQFYTRYGNPTLARVEALIAQLENTEAALVTASGMAAITVALLSSVRAGDHVVAQTSLYGGTANLLANWLPRFGVDAAFVDQSDPDAFAGALQPNTRVLFLESPSNPLLRITDLRAVTALARERGITTIADNTFATPYNQRPADFGVDIVVHSATKNLNGHSDVIAGAIAGSAERVRLCWETSAALGAVLGPIDGWLLLRGLRTLAVRMERHNRTAQRVAEMLAAHPNVAAVHYPGLPTHEQHALARAQMRGFGGILSFEVRGRFEDAERVISSLRLPLRAASVGGTESLVVHPAAMWRGMFDENALSAMGLAPSLIRLSVGLENDDDLLADLDQALSSGMGAAASGGKGVHG